MGSRGQGKRTILYLEKRLVLLQLKKTKKGLKFMPGVAKKLPSGKKLPPQDFFMCPLNFFGNYARQFFSKNFRNKMNLVGNEQTNKEKLLQVGG